jgi:hypothetical protein
MEGAGVILLDSRIYSSVEVFKEWDKWSKASFGPMLASTGLRLGAERCFPLEDKKPSRQTISFNYFKDTESFLAFNRTPEVAAYDKDIFTTWGGKFERMMSVYLVVARFQGNKFTPIDQGDIVDKDTRLKEFPIEDSPVILLKGLGLSYEDWGKYDAWVKELGYDVYIPLLLKVPGTIEYCRCWLYNVSTQGSAMPSLPQKLGITEIQDYPQDLSFIYFENIKAYQNFLTSKELLAYNKTLATTCPCGLNYRWDKAFRLITRFSK